MVAVVVKCLGRIHGICCQGCLVSDTSSGSDTLRQPRQEERCQVVVCRYGQDMRYPMRFTEWLVNTLFRRMHVSATLFACWFLKLRYDSWSCNVIWMRPVSDMWQLQSDRLPGAGLVQWVEVCVEAWGPTADCGEPIRPIMFRITSWPKGSRLLMLFFFANVFFSRVIIFSSWKVGVKGFHICDHPVMTTNVHKPSHTFWYDWNLSMVTESQRHRVTGWT